MPRKNYTILHDELVSGLDRCLDVAKIAFPETKFAEAESFNFSAFGLQPELSQHFAEAFFAYGFDKRPATRKAAYDAIKRFFEFLEVRSTRGNRIERALDLSRDVFNEYRLWLLARQTKAGASVYYNTTRRVVLSLSRVAPEGFRVCEVPRFGTGPGSRPRAGLPVEIAEQVLAAAREERKSVWETFQRGQELVADASRRIDTDQLVSLPVAAYTADLGLLLLYICEAYGGVVPIGYCNQREGKYDWRLIEGIAAHGGVDAISRYLHATARTLAPFLILIGDGTWANAEALLQFRRNCLRGDEVFPYRVNVVWDKPRARREQRRSFDSRKTGSVPRLIEQVLVLTSRLVPFVRKREQDALFLARGTRWIGIPANESDESVINLALEDFVRRHRLQDLSGSPRRLRLSDLRPTAMKRELRRGRDIASVQRLANHRFVSTTVRYVDDVLSEEATRAIAAAQESLYERPDAMRVSVQIGLAERPGLACSDPTNGRGPGASVGQLCPNWLAELLNPNLIVPGEPKYVARLLQVRQQLRASQERMLARRFELLYRPCLDALESALGHFEDPTLLEQAHELVSTLPPLIRLEIA